MRLYLKQIEDLKSEPIDVTGALALEIELENGARFSMAIDDATDHLDIHALGGSFVLQVVPRAANAVYIRLRR